MSIPPTELKRLFARSGNRCAFTDCHRLLIVDGGPGQPPVTLGDVAHIVAASPAGPRGEVLMAPSDRNRYENLILLCNIHHQLIDAAPATFTPARLRGMKEAHERWVQQRLAAGVEDDPAVPLYRDDRLYSTLLPVARMPTYVHSARSRFKTELEVQARLGPLRGREMAPFILREDKVVAFQDLRGKGNPFGEVIVGTPERHRIADWLDDPDRFRWLVTLLNRSLNKLTGRRGLHLDKDHHRYYFAMTESGVPRYETYRPLNASKATRAVVWQPVRKQTGEPRRYWYHRAVALRFTRIGNADWCLSIRPELRVTTDGVKPLESHAIGPRVTHTKSHLFNYDLLAEVQFWRDFLSDSSTRIVFPFGPSSQRIVVLTELMHGTVSWPGIPAEHAKPFRNVAYVDDLFSWAEAELPAVGEELEEVEAEEAQDDDQLG